MTQESFLTGGFFDQEAFCVFFLQSNDIQQLSVLELSDVSNGTVVADALYVVPHNPTPN
ncbi:MAG: hypothetical protein NPIRA05_08110 [Nitrospirales bacterium]|nr:MAG: hypothetical protein NPIRA05_08110 [Nitrospirales bacterium]